MTRRFFIKVFALCAVLFGLAACAQAPEPALVQGSAEASGAVLRLSESNACYNLQIDYPLLGDKRLDRNIGNWAKERYASSSAEFNALCARVAPKQPFRLWVSYELHSTPRTVSVVFTTLIYAGGDQYHDKIDALNYLRQNGGELGYRDLFMSAEGLAEVLSASAKKSLAPALAELWRENPEYSAALEPAEDAFGKFAILEDGLRLYFPTRQIAPFYAGPQQCAVPLGELAPLGPRPEIWE